LRWCERSRVSYVVGLARNARLQARVQYAEAMLAEQYECSGVKQRLIDEFVYAADSWDLERRVITRLEHGAQGNNPRFVVTNLEGEATQLYEKLYCARGEAENRIKEARRRHSSCPVVLPHEGMLLVGSLSFWLLFFHLHGRRRWACGRRLRRWATQPRSGALSMAATGAPQAHRPHAHGLPGAKRPSPSAALKFRVWVTLRLVLAQTCVGCP